MISSEPPSSGCAVAVLSRPCSGPMTPPLLSSAGPPLLHHPSQDPDEIIAVSHLKSCTDADADAKPGSP
jgi:hypothetical protein